MNELYSRVNAKNAEIRAVRTQAEQLLKPQSVAVTPNEPNVIP